MEEQVYMEAPSGFDKVFTWIKFIGWIKVYMGWSMRVWFGRFNKTMSKMKYKQSQGYHTLFIKHSTLEGVTARNLDYSTSCP